MPDFEELFMQSKGQPIEYNGHRVIRSDKFPVKNEDILIARIEKTNSDCRQGLCIDITGYCVAPHAGAWIETLEKVRVCVRKKS